MASSQVEIASSSSPFGHVLRDRNSRRDRITPNTYPKKLKDLVHSCIPSQPPTSTSDPNQNVNHVDFEDLWVHKPQWDNNNNESNNENNLPATTKIVNKSTSHKWDRAREMVLSSSSRTKQQRDASHSLCQSDESPNLGGGGGVSTLVRRWRDFETVSKCPNVGNNSTTGTACSSARSNGYDTCDESCSVNGRFETPMSLNEDLSGDWEPAMNDLPAAAAQGDSSLGMKKEKEKVRVVDIIRKLASSNGEENHESEHNGCSNALVITCDESLPRIKTSFDEHQPQQRCFFQVLYSPRIIRGRQALSDLILQMERDRRRELETLRKRKAVSKFQQKGFAQS